MIKFTVIGSGKKDKDVELEVKMLSYSLGMTRADRMSNVASQRWQTGMVSYRRWTVNTSLGGC